MSNRALFGQQGHWGGDIEKGLTAALIRSSHLLVIFSPSSLESLLVGYEIGHAKALSKTIIPFLTYPNLDVPMLLSRLNFYADLGQVEGYFRKLMDAFHQMAA
jgi:hypothetical protein